MLEDILISAIFAILAVLALGVLEFLTLLAYFKLRQKHPERKMLNEFIVMGGTVVVSFIARYIVAVLFLTKENGFDSVWDGMSNGLFALYALIGGLAFEGTYAPDELMGIMTVGWQILYYGALAYAGISMLLVVSTCVSYEFYSLFKVMGFLRKYDTVYIFTDVAEESVIMAMDIDEQEKRRNKGSYAIMFMGNELEAFDHKNEIHREIMDRGYIYWSYAKVGDRERELSLLKKLHYTRKNSLRRDKGYNRNKMVHIFALRNDEKLCAAENKNSDFIFDDVYSLLLDYCKCLKTQDHNKIPTVVNYYLLTHGDINYEFYNTRCGEIVDGFFEKYGIENVEVDCGNGQKATKKQLALRYIQMHIMSEAKLTSDDLVYRWQEEFFQGGDPESNYQMYHASTLPNGNDVFRTAVFGFGKTGQYALKGIFVATSNLIVKENGYKSAQFVADVYDVGADKRSGEFSYAHPLFLCKADGGDHTPIADGELISWGKKASNDALNYLYAKALQSGAKLDKDKVWDDMAFPIVDYHTASCLRQDFMNKIDGSIGIFDKSNVRYNSFVVSMGNDEDDLIMANILIDDFKHEILLKDNAQATGIVTIFVHIRDEKNTHRLNWSALDRDYFKDTLRVITFGCREHIWSYDNIVNDEKASTYNYMYNVKSHAMEIEMGWGGTLTANEQAIIDSLANGNNLWLEIAQNDLLRKDMWLDINPFTKESNRSAYAFALNYRFMDEVANRELCERVEHLRWNRFHMANGWVYAEYGKKEKAFRRHNKEHNCLCPYDMLDKWTQAYDLINVQVGKFLDM